MILPSIIIAATLFFPKEAHAWSFKKMGPLGNGNPIEDSRGFTSQNTRDYSNTIFGPIPDYIGPEGFGYIPTLTDLFGERN